MPTLTDALSSIVDQSAPNGPDAAEILACATDDDMVKGEVLVCHLVGTGELARVVAAERYAP